MQQWEERVCLVLGEAGLGIVNLLDPLKEAVQGAYKACWVLPPCCLRRTALVTGMG